MELPKSLEDVIALADWLELLALQSADGNSSIGDLRDALQLPLGGKRADELARDTLIEIEDRVYAAEGAYPFELQGGDVLATKVRLSEYAAYIFCLFISYFGWQPEKGDSLNPRLLFEELACVAARQYLQGTVFQFGTSRRLTGPAGFRDTLEQLCHELGEGFGVRPSRTLHKQDDHVDLVAWRDFPDKRQSRLVVFGQCATGADWKEKISELQPKAFWDHWMKEALVSPLARSFFIPHRISDEGDRENWMYCARHGGILFDRCRVAYWAWTDNSAIQEDGRFLEWCTTTFPHLVPLVGDP